MSELIEKLEALTYSFDGREKMRQIVAEHEAQQQTQWISVEDEVPEIGQSFDAWNIRGERFPDHGAYVGHGWDKQGIKENMLIHSFTHWMPLPTPPEKEQG